MRFDNVIGRKSNCFYKIIIGLISLMVLISIFSPIALSVNAEFEPSSISPNGDDNLPPVADAGGPYSGIVGEEITFDASGSYDPDPEPDPDPQTISSVSCDLASSLSSNIGIKDVDSIELDNPINEPVLEAPTEPIKEDGALPEDPIGVPPDDPEPDNPDDSEDAVLLFRWDFDNDGNYDTDWSTSYLAPHTYSVEAIYYLTLEVIDKDGATGIDTTTVDVKGDSPDLPPMITGLAVADTKTGGVLSLAWDTCEATIDYYKIYRDAANIGTSIEPSYTDGGLINGETYSYQVSAVNEKGEGPRSDPVDGTPSSSNEPPIADAGDGYFQWIDPIFFNASNSTDPDGYIIGYRWDFDGDLKFDTEWLETPTIFHYYDDPGTYTVILEVMDNGSATDNDTTTATVVDDNKPPVADAGGPYNGTVNETIMFNGSKSYDPDGTITNYTWDFGDGAKGYGVTPTYSYVRNGTFVVKLTVRDNGSKTNTNTTYAEIIKERENRAPNKPEVAVTKSENKNEFLLTAVSTDPDGDMIKYFIKWGDDTNTTPPDFPGGTVLTTSHIYVIEGSYEIIVYAKDEHGVKSETTKITVEVDESIGDTVYSQLSERTDSLNEDLQYVVVAGIFSAIGLVGIGVFLYKKKSYDL